MLDKGPRIGEWSGEDGFADRLDLGGEVEQYRADGLTAYAQRSGCPAERIRCCGRIERATYGSSAL